MAIDKRLMKDIRLRRSIHELEASLKVSQAVSMQLLQVSGLREGAIQPELLRQSAVDVEALLQLAKKIETEESMLDPNLYRKPEGRRQV